MSTPAVTPTDNTFLDDVLNGLSRRQKTLPSKYFYDQRGSQLFEQICELDEYYLTRTELGILRRFATQMVADCNSDTCVIEPGAGAGVKAAILLQALAEASHFVPLEISSEALQMTQRHLGERFPALAIHPIHGDFTDPDDVQRASREINGQRRLVFFPGSTLGNFDRNGALTVLTNLRRLMGEHGSIIIGLDMIKDRRRLLAAYDDAAGVTAAFNKNLLRRLNRELDADFDLEHGFKHEARYNGDQHRIEMHLCSTRAQTVAVAGEMITFARGETIHTENSHKYSLPIIEALCAQTGLRIDRYWMDDNRDFCVCRLVSCH